MPEAMRLYRENIAFKAQIDTLNKCLTLYQTKKGRKRPARHTRRAGHGVPAHARQRRLPELLPVGQPADDQEVGDTLPELLASPPRGRTPADGRANRRARGDDEAREPDVGERRIQDELRRMGVKVARATIQKILRENGFRPFPGRPRPLLFERFRSGAKDALWALDFFAVKTAKGVWVQALLVIDIYTRELLEQSGQGLEIATEPRSSQPPGPAS
jgi:putative transposase